MESEVIEQVPEQPAQDATAPEAGTQATNGEQAAPDAAAPEQQEQETPEKRESRSRRRFNRERDARIAAETELRLLKEGRLQAANPQAPQPSRDDGAPKREQFESYEEYLVATTAYVAEKAAQKRIDEARRTEREAAQRAEQAKVAKEWESRIEKARDMVEDFDEVCRDSDAEVTAHMSAAILESDAGPLIAYHLAKNPDEAAKIAKLSPSRQAAAIVALEEKVAKPTKQRSNAPSPINPVKKAGGPENEMPSDKDDIDTWMRKEKARMEKAGVRL